MLGVSPPTPKFCLSVLRAPQASLCCGHCWGLDPSSNFLAGLMLQQMKQQLHCPAHPAVLHAAQGAHCPLHCPQHWPLPTSLPTMPTALPSPLPTTPPPPALLITAVSFLPTGHCSPHVMPPRPGQGLGGPGDTPSSLQPSRLTPAWQQLWGRGWGQGRQPSAQCSHIAKATAEPPEPPGTLNKQHVVTSPG